MDNRKVVVELKSGELVSGKLRDFYASQLQEVTVMGETQLHTSAPGISLYCGFADVVFLDIDTISKIHETQ